MGKKGGMLPPLFYLVMCINNHVSLMIVSGHYLLSHQNLYSDKWYYHDKYHQTSIDQL